MSEPVSASVVNNPDLSEYFDKINPQLSKPWSNPVANAGRAVTLMNLSGATLILVVRAYQATGWLVSVANVYLSQKDQAIYNDRVHRAKEFGRAFSKLHSDLHYQEVKLTFMKQPGWRPQAEIEAEIQKRRAARAAAEENEDTGEIDLSEYPPGTKVNVVPAWYWDNPEPITQIILPG